MPALDENTEDRAPRRKPKPVGLSAGESMLADKLDDVVDELRALRGQAPSGKQLIGAVLVVAGMFFANQVYLTSGILATRGVDLGAAADATKIVVGTAAPSTTTTTTTETVVEPAPTVVVPEPTPGP